jgi:hypothetical protein
MGIKPDSKILDPCYGDGALLLAARERLLELGCTAPAKQLYGYDIMPLTKRFERSVSGLIMRRI